MILLPTVCTKIESVCFATSFAKSFTESGAVSNTDILINSLASNASDNCFIKLEEIPDEELEIAQETNIDSNLVEALFSSYGYNIDLIKEETRNLLYRYGTLENMDATVTLAHSKTQNLAEITKNADILISATGVKHLITKDMVKYGSTVIDVGVTRVDGKIYGDVDFENIKDIARYITPNPGGVGPMTVAMIIDNLVEMEERKNG